MKAERHIEGYAVSPVVSLLMRGRERVVDGWWQAGKVRVGTVVCAVDALIRTDDLMLGYPYLARALPAPWTVVTKYNDHLTTTKADILSLYDRAIAMAIGESR